MSKHFELEKGFSHFSKAFLPFLGFLEPCTVECIPILNFSVPLKAGVMPKLEKLQYILKRVPGPKEDSLRKVNVVEVTFHQEVNKVSFTSNFLMRLSSTKEECGAGKTFHPPQEI